MDNNEEQGIDFNFEKDLSIRQFKLDEECLSHAVIFFRYSEAAAAAKARVSELNDLFKVVSAEQQIAIRNHFNKDGVKFTEAVIAAELEKDEKVNKIRDKLRRAEAVHGKLQIAVQAFDHRRSELDNLVRLYCAGYFAKPSGAEGARASVNEQTGKAARKALNKA